MPVVKTTVVASADALSHTAARWLENALTLAEARRGPDHQLRVCLSGGSTPKRLYELLATPHWAERLPWDRIAWYFGDDRFVPHDHADSNAHMVDAALFAHAPDTDVNVIPYGPDIEVCARAYDSLLRAAHAADAGAPLFDAVICGVGLDGHTASLFPGQPALVVGDRLAVAVPEAGQEPFVPRISLTFRALNDSRATAFLAAGADKRDILTRIFAGEDLPARRITAHDSLTWLLDEAAAPASLPRPGPAAG
ncbi:6-phosphogluconolactonase [Camelimonas fluminis]|uniref:6-phosphogluconolactonase n=1 Tax=Camelimonas fluminis TaxID=1576911 RepID=A0ABV7UDQ6_9HYPH|nr:6-phosphogluconolactonase [Camelimonas fluminis]GHE48438.1 6-phosphogluconolactonase [Camelimonas fluminis]